MFSIVLLIGVLIVGLFCYPNELAQSYGNHLPYILRRAAWFELWFFGLQLVIILQRWIIILPKLITGQGEVDWSRPPYPEYRILTVASIFPIPIFLFVALNLYGQIPPDAWVEKFIWGIFIITSVVAFIFRSLTLAIVKHVDGSIAEVMAYNISHRNDSLSGGRSRSIPVLISVIITLSLMYIFHWIASNVLTTIPK